MTKIKKEDFHLLFKQVISQNLCVRCGMCAGICPTNAIGFDDNAFPELRSDCIACGFCVRCCPGGEVNFPELSRQTFNSDYDPDDLRGYVENMFVGYSTNQVIRRAGASGGLTTGLLVYLLEKKKIDGAIVVDMDSEKGYETKGILATTTKEIKDAAQSKYCITPSMEVLQTIRKTKGRFAVVALPCQLHGLKKLAQIDPALSNKIIYHFGLICNCTLDKNGHIDAMRACNINLDDVKRFNFRGNGWPGGFHVQKKDGSEISLHKINIKNVMNVMFRIYGSKRCYLCYDALAEYADLSFGDGKKLLEEAMADGAIHMNILPAERDSQRILQMARGKKNRTIARLYERKNKGYPNPNYFFSLPEPTQQAKRSIKRYNLFQLFRGPFRRKIVLWVLFSPIGTLLDRVNIIRKNTFHNYHDN